MAIKVLVTGANGQLGKTIKDVSKGVSSAIEFVFVDKSELDISQHVSLTNVLKNENFDYCINCAAYTNVDLAETERDQSNRINAVAVKYLAMACHNYNIVLFHISTDYVFDGMKTSPYLENDSTHPINAYGQSKLLGEQSITEYLERYFIIRTSWLFSKYNGNFVKTIHDKLVNNEQLTVITSQKGVPTSCIDLANFMLYVIQHEIKDFGIYHYALNGETTWYGLAMHIARFLNKSSNVTPIESYTSKAKRPSYSVLSNSKVQLLLNRPMKNWSESVDTVLHILSKA